MAELKELVAYCDELLAVDRFQDYCPNGLQVAGRSPVRRIVAGVTACQALLDAAVARGADLVMVHHGWFWKGEPAPVTGLKYHRLRTLLKHDIGLLAYHLPLDAHRELGNNAQLAERLGFEVTGPLNDEGIGLVGRLAEPLPAAALARHVGERLGREPLLVAGGDHPVRRVAWCTGAAQGYIEQAVAKGADLYLSGEISEQTVHVAREAGIHYLAAGHHATERYGIQALARHVAGWFGIEWEYVDIDNPA